MMDETVVDRNTDPHSIQRELVQYLIEQNVTLDSIATVLQVTKVRASKIVRGIASMTMPEFSRLLFATGFAWPGITAFERARPLAIPSVAEIEQHVKPVGSKAYNVAKQTAKRHKRTGGLTNDEHKTSMNTILLLIARTRTELESKMTNPLDGINVPEGQELTPMDAIWVAHSRLALSVPGDDPVQKQQALGLFCQRVSTQLAKAVNARIEPKLRHDLARFYAAHPDALVTRYDLICGVGGHIKRMPAAELHNLGMAASVRVN